MSVLKHSKTFQQVSIFSDHLQGARRFLVEVIECGRAALTHTTRYAATSPQLTFTIFKNF